MNNKFLEYIKLIPKGIENIDSILEGISNQVKMKYNKLDEDQQDEIIKRRIICKVCPFMSKNALDSEEYFQLTGNHYETSRKDEHCSFCSCPLGTRTASLSQSCGIQTWNSTNTDKKLELKWDKYEK